MALTSDARVPLTSRPPHVRPRRPAWRVGALVLLGTLVLQLGWLLSLPPFAGIDEIDHVFRASSVEEGHVRPDYLPLGGSGRADGTGTKTGGQGDLIPVRDDIARAARAPCRSLAYKSAPMCTPTRTLTGDEVLIGSSAARYDPAFYLVTGYLSRPFHGDHALYAMRIVGATMSALLLAWTAAVVAGRSRTAWPLLVLLTAATPIVVYATTVASPNGLHTVSALGLWTALLGLFWGQPPDPRQRSMLLSLGAVCGVALVLTHSLAGLWLALTLLTVLVLVGPRRVVERVRTATRPHLVAALPVGLAAFASAVWIVLDRTNDPSAAAVIDRHSPAPAVADGLILWPLQAIAAFPTREQVASPVVYAVVLGLVLALGALGVRRATPRVRWTLLAIVVVSYAVPAALTVATYSRLGPAWQGRYGIPFAVGALLILGEVLDRSTARPLPRGLLVGVGALLAAAELFSWTSNVHAVLRKELWRTTDRWHQPSLTVLVLIALVAATLWARALIVSGGRREP